MIYELVKSIRKPLKEISIVPVLKAKAYSLIPKENPIRELVKNDKHWEVLTKYGLIYPLYLRDYLLKREYKQLRFDYSQKDAITELAKKHHYSRGTIEQIVLSKNYRYNINQKNETRRNQRKSS
jgi:hypothetical protein